LTEQIILLAEAAYVNAFRRLQERGYHVEIGTGYGPAFSQLVESSFSHRVAMGHLFVVIAVT